MIGVVELAIAAITFAVAYYIYLTRRSPRALSSSSASNAKFVEVHTAAGTDTLINAKHPLTIYYGSQSGTAETFARELHEESKVYGYASRVVDLEDFDEDELSKNKLSIFLISTFGEGEPPDNAITFYQWCKANVSADGTPKDELEGTKFCVFALGNRQYEHFCSVGKFIDQALEMLGASRTIDRVDGDDDGNLEEDFAQWKKAFWLSTNTMFGTVNSTALTQQNESKPFQSSYTVNALTGELERKARASYSGGLTNFIGDPKYRIVSVPCVETRELRQKPDTLSSTKHLEFSLANVHLPYLTADNLGVYPVNRANVVTKFLARLGYDANQLFILRGNGNKKSYLPSPCSVKDLLTHYLDIQFLPRLSQLPILSHYCSEESDKKQLYEWCHSQQAEFVAHHYTLIEVIDRLPSLATIPMADLCDWCPKLTPRFYTISSSSLVQPKQLSITVSLLTHHKINDRVQPGICSEFLCQLNVGDKIACFIRPSSFRLPKYKAIPNTSTGSDGVSVPAQPASVLPPIIMIGPGTGIAPFRGFIQEARAVRLKGSSTIGNLTLFFGCRDSCQDFIYEGELKQAVEERVLHRLHLAFSREQSVEPNTAPPKKVYVQDRLRASAREIWHEIQDQRAYIYICGGTAMGRSIRETIIELAKTEGGMTDIQAEAFIKTMQEQKRFIQELWS